MTMIMPLSCTYVTFEMGENAAAFTEIASMLPPSQYDKYTIHSRTHTHDSYYWINIVCEQFSTT